MVLVTVGRSFFFDGCDDAQRDYKAEDSNA